MDPLTISAITGGVSAISNLIGAGIAGKKSKDANEAAEKAIRQQQRENEDWYRNKKNENYLETVEAQAALTKARDMAKEQMAQARASQAVMGGTDASLAQTQDAVGNMISDTTTGLAEVGAAKKEAAEQQYLNNKSALAQQVVSMYQNKAAQNAQAGSNALSALSGIGSSLIMGLGAGK